MEKDCHPLYLTMNNELAQGKGLPALRLTKGSHSLNYGPWGESIIFGHIYTTPLFNQFVVTVYKPYKSPDGGRGGSWSTKDGKCIVAPAINREEALAILKKISHQRLPPYEYWIN